MKIACIAKLCEFSAVAAIILCAPPAGAQDNKFVLGGYGEILYSHFDYGPDQKSGANGSPPGSRAIMDIPRLILEFEYNFTNQDKLNAAAEAWKAMREPWEASEAFLFGPAEFLSLDPSLDSWPVDRQQLDQVLASGFELTPDFIKNGLGPALRGFHTVEYLLFRDGSPRHAATVTPREREYLAAVTRVLADDAAALAEAWANGFADEFAKAGKTGSRYGSQNDAVAEIIDKIGAIPFPFSNNLNAAAPIQAAQQAIMKVQTTLEQDVKKLLSN